MSLGTTLKYKNVARKLMLLFAVAVGTGISVVYLLNKKTQKLVRQNIDLSEIINISGRQRMLSQNISKQLIIDYYTDNHFEENLNTSLLPFQRSQTYLMEVNETIHIPEKYRIRLFDLFESIQPYYNEIQRLSGLKSSEGKIGQDNMFALREAESKFLILMDEITNVYEKASSELYSEIHDNVKISSLIIISLILLFSMTVLVVTLRIIEKFSQQLRLSIRTQKSTNKKLEIALVDQEKKVEELEVVTNFWKTAREEAVKNGNIKSQFLSTMSHEIRTPMNAIIGATNLLELENPELNQDDRFRLLKISSTNLLSLINDILDYQKISSGNLSLNKRSFDIKELLENISGVWEPLAKEKGVDLVWKLESGLANSLYIGDSIRISQVLNNLMNNALKFTDDGIIQLRVKGSGDALRFEVQDTGIGIPPESLDSIFDQFSQVDGGNTQKVGGTGLGLAISQEIVKLMGGEIQVESSVDFGSKFFFSLDLERGNLEKKSKSSTVKEAPSKGSAKILLVEDNLGNQTIASGFLKQWGFTYEIANNGAEALDKISSMDFDLVLMDLRMPVLNGFDTSTQIRARHDSYYKNVPIIALSASTFSETKSQIYEAGMNDFVSKPFDPHDLHERILKYTNKVLKTAV